MVYSPDADLDLVLQREVDVPVELVWKAWTTPDLLKRWFTPAPWQTSACEIDLRPGGLFRTVMRGPEGQAVANDGCYLDVVENERLVWTNALGAGYRPQPPVAPANDFAFPFTAIVGLRRSGTGTLYTTTVLHADQKGRQTHSDMGFHHGWGTALDQLVALAKAI